MMHRRQLREIRFTFAEVNELRLCYASVGEGKLILFLHGFPDFWYAWRKQLTDFGPDFLSVAPDLRGYNLPSQPADVDQYHLKFLVEDVRALPEHLSQEHDWGGVVAWAFAAQYPQGLEKLIIINAPHPAIFDRELRENPAQQKASQYMLRFRSAGAEQILSSANYSILDENILQPGLKEGYFSDEDRRAYFKIWILQYAIMVLIGGLL
jgi:pimeloyl-ACP methyl ester carboxylesterase